MIGPQGRDVNMCGRVERGRDKQTTSICQMGQFETEVLIPSKNRCNEESWGTASSQDGAGPLPFAEVVWPGYTPSIRP